VILLEISRISSAEARADMVVLPTGSTEQHGPHLPLGTDALIAEGIARRLADKIGADMAPLLAYGLSEHHMDFKGTVTLKPGTYVSVITELLESFARHDYSSIIIVNGHGGNISAINTAVQDFHRKHETRVYMFNWWLLEGATGEDIKEDWHAGDIETSVAMALGIDLRGKPVDEMKIPPKGLKLRRVKDVSESGVIGYPTNATKEKGERVLSAILDDMKKIIQQPF
jgi:creatinine amidohydrolase